MREERGREGRDEGGKRKGGVGGKKERRKEVERAEGCRRRGMREWIAGWRRQPGDAEREMGGREREQGGKREKGGKGG